VREGGPGRWARVVAVVCGRPPVPRCSRRARRAAERLHAVSSARRAADGIMDPDKLQEQLKEERERLQKVEGELLRLEAEVVFTRKDGEDTVRQLKVAQREVGEERAAREAAERKVAELEKGVAAAAHEAESARAAAAEREAAGVQALTVAQAQLAAAAAEASEREGELAGLREANAALLQQLDSDVQAITELDQEVKSAVAQLAEAQALSARLSSDLAAAEERGTGLAAEGKAARQEATAARAAAAAAEEAAAQSEARRVAEAAAASDALSAAVAEAEATGVAAVREVAAAVARLGEEAAAATSGAVPGVAAVVEAARGVAGSSRAQVSALRGDLDDMRRLAELWETERTQHLRRAADLEAGCAALRGEVAALTAREDKLQGEVESLQAVIHQQRTSREGSAIESPRPAELALTEEQLEMARDRVHGLEASLRESYSEVDWLREQLAQQRAEEEKTVPPHELAALAAQVDTLRGEVEERDTALRMHEAELQAALVHAADLPGTELQRLSLRELCGRVSHVASSHRSAAAALALAESTVDDRDAQIRALQCRMAELERRLEAPRVEHHREWATPSNAGYHHDFGDNNYYEDKGANGAVLRSLDVRRDGGIDHEESRPRGNSNAAAGYYRANRPSGNSFRGLGLEALRGDGYHDGQGGGRSDPASNGNGPGGTSNGDSKPARPWSAPTAKPQLAATADVRGPSKLVRPSSSGRIHTNLNDTLDTSDSYQELDASELLATSPGEASPAAAPESDEAEESESSDDDWIGRRLNPSNPRLSALRGPRSSAGADETRNATHSTAYPRRNTSQLSNPERRRTPPSDDESSSSGEEGSFGVQRRPSLSATSSPPPLLAKHGLPSKGDTRPPAARPPTYHQRIRSLSTGTWNFSESPPNRRQR